MAQTTTLTIFNLSLRDAQQVADSLEEDQAAPLAVSINETDEAQGLWNVVAYFRDQPAAEAAQQALATSHALNGNFQLDSIPEAGWVERSLKDLSPVIAGRFFLHGAHDRQLRRPGGISLEIDAGTAFGTGHHATTTGCLLAFERLLKRFRPFNILDVGTGTGVLALAAAKATHRRVIASDIDPEAVRVALHNATVNSLRPWIKALPAAGLRHPAVGRSAPYDLIFANILARPLIALAPDLSEALAPGGKLILSGLTSDQIRPVVAAYRNHGLIFESCQPIGQWRTLTLAEHKKTPGLRRHRALHKVNGKRLRHPTPSYGFRTASCRYRRATGRQAAPAGVRRASG
jgi:ribosomal protein L11 methyltransferase